jgi:restriction system protein
MAIPDFQSLMLPVLKASAAGEIKISDVITQLGQPCWQEVSAI